MQNILYPKHFEFYAYQSPHSWNISGRNRTNVLKQLPHWPVPIGSYTVPENWYLQDTLSFPAFSVVSVCCLVFSCSDRWGISLISCVFMTLILTLQLSPEEEERRRLRRERNKLAAAKCRQRRVDQTNTLINVSIDNFYQVAPVTITGTTIAVPYLLSQVIATHMKIGHRRFHLRVPYLQMSCCDLTRMRGYRDCRSNNDHQAP